jgi:hypothetical protein
MVSMKHTQTMPSQDADAWVSALLDGELDDGEAKRALGRFPARRMPRRAGRNTT